MISQHAFTLNDLTLSYGKNVIVDNLSTKIKAGKLTALIGPNGSGKSTLLKSLVKLIPSNSGDIWLEDNVSAKKLNSKQLAQRVSMLPQSPVTPEGVTVKDLVGFGRAPYLNALGTLTEQDKWHINEAMRQTEIIEFADRPIAALSGGQRQRVWIAMILAQDTKTVLLDEPTTYLDLAHQYELLDILQNLVNKGKSVVVVLHDLNQACRYADELIVMKSGQIYDQGSPVNTFTEPMLSEVFSLNARIIDDPETDTPMAIPRRLQTSMTTCN